MRAMSVEVEEQEQMIWLSTRTLASWITILQMPVAVYFLCRHPIMPVEVYGTSVQMSSSSNNTALDIHNPVAVAILYHVNVAPLFITSSFLLTAYGTIASYTDDVNIDLTRQVYETTNETLLQNPFFILWHFVFASIVILHHALYPIIVCSPFDTHTLVIIVVPMIASLHAMYTPKLSPDHDADAPGNTKVRYMITTQIITFGFFFAVSVALCNIPYDPFGSRMKLLASLIMLDVLCIFVVHMFDITPQMVPVVNSRLVYTALLSILNLTTIIIFQTSIQVCCSPFSS
jgi:hypothetical protein